MLVSIGVGTGFAVGTGVGGLLVAMGVIGGPAGEDGAGGLPVGSAGSEAAREETGQRVEAAGGIGDVDGSDLAEERRRRGDSGHRLDSGANLGRRIGSWRWYGRHGVQI